MYLAILHLRLEGGSGKSANQQPERNKGPDGALLRIYGIVTPALEFQPIWNPD
jgi:hypothetical protein